MESPRPEDIKCSAAQPTVRQRIEQSCLVDKRRAGRVDEDGESASSMPGPHRRLGTASLPIAVHGDSHNHCASAVLRDRQTRHPRGTDRGAEWRPGTSTWKPFSRATTARAIGPRPINPTVLRYRSVPGKIDQRPLRITVCDSEMRRPTDSISPIV